MGKFMTPPYDEIKSMLLMINFLIDKITTESLMDLLKKHLEKMIYILYFTLDYKVKTPIRNNSISMLKIILE
jgi:hypothetical protein